MNESGAVQSRSKRWLGRALLPALAILSALALAEGALRVLDFAPPAGLFTVSDPEFRDVPGIFAPGQRLIERPGTQFEHKISINALGYRGGEFSKSKPKGQLRFLYVGDSFTWGHNVSDDQTSPAQLQRILYERCGDVVVANAGLSGSTILGQEALIRRGLAIDPDIVILMYHENDLDELISSRMWDQLAANRRAKSRFPVSVLYPVLRSTALWNLALDVRRRAQFREQRRRAAGDSSIPPAGGHPDLIEQARQEYRERFTTIVDQTAQVDIPLLFVAFPHPASVEAGVGGRDYDWVLKLSNDLGVPTVDLLGPLQNSPLPVSSMFLLPQDYHPSPAGHEFVAARVADFLSNFDSVERACGQTPF